MYFNNYATIGDTEEDFMQRDDKDYLYNSNFDASSLEELVSKKTIKPKTINQAMKKPRTLHKPKTIPTPVSLGQRRKELSTKINAAPKPEVDDLREYHKVSEQIDALLNRQLKKMEEEFNI